MEESLYQAEKNTEVIEKKLESILNDAEEQKTFNSQNFVSLKTLVFIWVIGSETSCRKAELLFKEEIKKIVSDIRLSRSSVTGKEQQEKRHFMLLQAGSIRHRRIIWMSDLTKS